ncbi:hypothetical protein [Fibrella aquatilis]|uniref:Uncharacterized protein n=1 Tax=Fibrella aquatilis TaxID=2817059 RepID=A0A939G2Q5_9BACT|nr:hypothetical protein [Fibrella aquatilis]MBO0930979.1 hypothetical protein [Fibrella aquatilis]
MNQLALLSVFCLLWACKSGGKQQALEAQLPVQLPIIVTMSDPTAKNDTVEVASTLTDSTYILNVGIYHSNEVDQTAIQRDWFGLFKRGESYYLDHCALRVKRVDDPVGADGLAWDISVSNKDSSVLLINPPTFLKPNAVPHIELSKRHLAPGDSLRFVFGSTDYTLFATGTLVGEGDDKYEQDYRLYLSAANNGHHVTQLLEQKQQSDGDTQTTILFVGDIDGDDKLDFLINTTAHYNAFVPTLFLSKPALKNNLVKLVGKHISVGC